jgi:hypothetical protein
MNAAMATRVELKHAVPETIAAQAVEWASSFLPPDPSHAGPQRVTSLYLDSPELTFYRWHVDQCTDRFKLRVRCYGDAPCHRVYAEVKQKAGGVGSKSRAPLTVSALSALLSDVPGDCPPLPADPALDEFLACRRAYGAAPTMMIRSTREAWRDNDVAGELAVTVDRQIAYRPATDIDLLAQARSWNALRLPQRDAEEARAILEIKYADRPPAWMDALLRYIAPYRLPFSKYAAAVRQHVEGTVQEASIAEPNARRAFNAGIAEIAESNSSRS